MKAVVLAASPQEEGNVIPQKRRCAPGEVLEGLRCSALPVAETAEHKHVQRSARSKPWGEASAGHRKRRRDTQRPSKPHLWVLSGRNQKVPPPAGTQTDRIEQVQTKKVIVRLLPAFHTRPSGTLSPGEGIKRCKLNLKEGDKLGFILSFYIPGWGLQPEGI